MPNYLTNDELAHAKSLLDRMTTIYQHTVVGQEGLRRALTASLLAGGHVLVESVPGLAKTTAAQTLASAVSGTFHRIQCTPDLMPNDIVGSQIWNQERGEMVTQLGPVHANMVLLDEINRSSAKTQSAMLEAMQERQTTIGGVNHKLPSPFMVMATQNPIEEEGTYVLPEAQMDRFLLKEVITYPTPVEELEVLTRIDSGQMSSQSAVAPITLDDVRTLQEARRRVFVHETLKAYIVDIVNTTRGAGPNPLPGWNKHVRVGASPRGGIALMQIAQALALMAGRNHVMPDDIKEMRYGILRHRIIRTFDALADNVSIEGLIDAVFNAVPVP
nr:MoxR family ATPase [Schaalia odontolytica]